MAQIPLGDVPASAPRSGASGRGRSPQAAEFPGARSLQAPERLFAIPHGAVGHLRPAVVALALADACDARLAHMPRGRQRLPGCLAVRIQAVRNRGARHLVGRHPLTALPRRGPPNTADLSALIPRTSKFSPILSTYRPEGGAAGARLPRRANAPRTRTRTSQKTLGCGPHTPRAARRPARAARRPRTCPELQRLRFFGSSQFSTVCETPRNVDMRTPGNKTAAAGAPRPISGRVAGQMARHRSCRRFSAIAFMPRVCGPLHGGCRSTALPAKNRGRIDKETPGGTRMAIMAAGETEAASAGARSAPMRTAAPVHMADQTGLGVGDVLAWRPGGARGRGVASVPKSGSARRRGRARKSARSAILAAS